jgi:hypothetical protein
MRKLVLGCLLAASLFAQRREPMKSKTRAAAADPWSRPRKVQSAESSKTAFMSSWEFLTRRPLSVHGRAGQCCTGCSGILLPSAGIPAVWRWAGNRPEPRTRASIKSRP